MIRGSIFWASISTIWSGFSDQDFLKWKKFLKKIMDDKNRQRCHVNSRRQGWPSIHLLRQLQQPNMAIFTGFYPAFISNVKSSIPIKKDDCSFETLSIPPVFGCNETPGEFSDRVDFTQIRNGWIAVAATLEKQYATQVLTSSIELRNSHVIIYRSHDPTWRYNMQ